MIIIVVMVIMYMYVTKQLSISFYCYKLPYSNIILNKEELKLPRACMMTQRLRDFRAPANISKTKTKHEQRKTIVYLNPPCLFICLYKRIIML